MGGMESFSHVSGHVNDEEFLTVSDGSISCLDSCAFAKHYVEDIDVSSIDQANRKVIVRLMCFPDQGCLAKRLDAIDILAIDED